MNGGLMGGYPLGHFINIPDQRKCICTPAIAGISDGPNVDCPIHGDGA